MKFINSAFLKAIFNGKILILDALALLLVFLTPKIGEAFNLPFYMLEPMRLMVVLSIANANRHNSYVLALILPFFSWAVSGHPEFLKMMVMTCELTVNIFLFYFLFQKSHNAFLSMILSIVASKILCYALYLVFFTIMFVKEEAEPSFLVAQVISTLVFSLYILFVFRKKQLMNP
jgi:hypothetical protein